MKDKNISSQYIKALAKAKNLNSILIAINDIEKEKQLFNKYYSRLSLIYKIQKHNLKYNDSIDYQDSIEIIKDNIVEIRNNIM